jgi:hypothetical protein
MISWAMVDGQWDHMQLKVLQPQHVLAMARPLELPWMQQSWLAPTQMED